MMDVKSLLKLLLEPNWSSKTHKSAIKAEDLKHSARRANAALDELRLELMLAAEEADPDDGLRPRHPQ